MYDPSTGRFITQDPSEFVGGDENLYRYVHNAPTIYVDPTGYGASLGDDGHYHWDPLTSLYVKIIECKKIHDEYDPLYKDYAGYKNECDPEKLKKKCDAINREIELRQKYLDLRCDWVPWDENYGKRRPEDCKTGHEEQVIGKKNAYKKCMDRLKDLQKK